MNNNQIDNTSYYTLPEHYMLFIAYRAGADERSVRIVFDDLIREAKEY